MTPAELTGAVAQRFPGAVLASHTYRGDATVMVRPESLVEIARVLKDDSAFQMNFLMDVTAVDYSTTGLLRSILSVVPAATPLFLLNSPWRRHKFWLRAQN